MMAAMNRGSVTRRALIAALLSTALACAKRSDRVRIAVVPQGSTHEFWKSMHAGAEKARRDLAAQGKHVEVIWKGPLREGDREQQTQVVEGFMSQGVSGIVLAPFDSRALVRPVEEAAHAGIPTVVLDSALDTDQIVSFIATDNEKGGALAADRVSELLKGAGKVLLLRYQEGSASTAAREKGFVDRLAAAHPGVQIVSSNQYAGGTRDTAKAASENLLTAHGSEIQGVFTPNESSTAGMLLALQDYKLAGRVVFVGFDASETFLQAMKAGQLHGIVVQDPFRMGELGVKAMADHLAGMAVAKRVDTGATVVTPENMDAPEVTRLLHPPLAEYLEH
jgi:ribose transport system substrate-binding protein